MSKITKEISVDVSKKNMFEAIVAKQRDTNSRFLKVTLCNEGKKISVPQTAQAVLNVRRADKSSMAFLGTVNSDGTVTVPLTSWVLGLDDVVSCSVSIIGDDEQRLTSTSFEVNVEAAEYCGDDISEEEAEDVLTQLLATAAAANTAAANADTKAQAANIAAYNANSNANNAYNAATSANTAANEASSAATQATNAAESASQAAQAANTATTAANNAVQEAQEALEVMNVAVNHRNIYRGKNLGSTVTAAQKAAIQNGTFDDLYIGDYWTIDGVNWVIADMDYFYQTGDTAFTQHHLVIIPRGNLYRARMNPTNTTAGGYVGSEMYTTNLEQAKTKIRAAFGDIVLSHRDVLINAVTDGHPSGYVWVESEVELMTEVMVYGTYNYAVMNIGTPIPTKYTTARQQFSIFSLNPYDAFRRNTYWLRDIVSSTAFAYIQGYGAVAYNHASNTFAVRPYFCIG